MFTAASVAYASLVWMCKRVLGLWSEIALVPLRRLPWFPAFAKKHRISVVLVPYVALLVLLAQDLPRAIEWPVATLLVALVGAVGYFTTAERGIGLITEQVSRGWLGAFGKYLRHPLDVEVWLMGLHISVVQAVMVVGFTSRFLSVFTVASYFLFSFAHVARTETWAHVSTHNRCGVISSKAPRLVRMVGWAVWQFIDVGMQFTGRILAFYRVHHTNHHIENNGPEDTCSTIYYDRSSFIDFCRYSLVWMLELLTAHKTIRYMRATKRKRLLGDVVVGMLRFYAMLVAIALVLPPLAICVLALRISAGVTQAAVNLRWHALFEPADPVNYWSNSLNLDWGDQNIDDFDPFASSLHAFHHHEMQLHWSVISQRHAALGSLPKDQLTNSIKPRRTELFPMFLARDYEALSALLTIGGSDEEKKALVRRRLEIPAVPRRDNLAGSRFDRALSKMLARTMVGYLSPR